MYFNRCFETCYLNHFWLIFICIDLSEVYSTYYVTFNSKNPNGFMNMDAWQVGIVLQCIQMFQDTLLLLT